jgi:hypothetical protein
MTQRPASRSRRHRRNAQLRLFEQRVRPATDSPVGASYCVHRDVNRKADCLDTFGIVLASMQCRGLRRNSITPDPQFGFLAEVGSKEVSIMKSLTFTQWYRILRAHYQWTVFQSIQYALWLTR